MIYTLKRDDMPSLSQWIKKEATFGRQKLLLFWLRGWDFSCPPPSHSRCASQSQIAPSSPCFGRFRFTINNHLDCFLLATHDLRHRPFGSNPFLHKKRKTNHKGWFLFLVAGVGFEPHGLRVMSPTSYQAALPRDIWCRKPGSNRYEM